MFRKTKIVCTIGPASSDESIIEQMCKEFDVELEIINQSDTLSYEEELVEDVLSVITVFSSKLYGSRSHKNKTIIKENKKMFKKDDGNQPS